MHKFKLVSTIGTGAFKGCSSLESVTIGKKVRDIYNGAFEGCSSLTSITIPDSVTFIGYSAFAQCSSLTMVYYTGTKEQWNNIFIGWGNEALTNATIIYNYKG